MPRSIASAFRLNLTASLVAGNTAVSDGGGIFVFGATLNSLNSTVAYNLANLSTGGGISIQNSANGTAAAALTNSTIAFNRSTTNGGGITHRWTHAQEHVDRWQHRPDQHGPECGIHLAGL